VIGAHHPWERPGESEDAPTDDAQNSAKVWFKCDEHPLVVNRVLSRDQLFRAVHEKRVRALWVSRRKLLVHVDAAEDLQRAGPPGIK
jgi:hypothetical protein